MSLAEGMLSLDFCLRDRDHARAGKLRDLAIPVDMWVLDASSTADTKL